MMMMISGMSIGMKIGGTGRHELLIFKFDRIRLHWLCLGQRCEEEKIQEFLLCQFLIEFPPPKKSGRFLGLGFPPSVKILKGFPS